MSALTIFIIRHAEKPKEQWPGPGLDINGVPDKKSLVIRGWQRAGAWATLFGANPSSEDYPRPAAIFAAKPEKDDAAKPENDDPANLDKDDSSDDPSQRPYETIVPLAAKLDVTPAIDLPKGAEADLARRLTSQSGTVLVCWEHKAIIDGLLPALKGDQGISDLPADWDGARFDVVLRLDRQHANAPWTFQQLFPCLLSGDSDTPLE